MDKALRAVAGVSDVSVELESKLARVTTINASDTLQYFYDGQPISPWHDVPFTFSGDEHGTPLLSFICEIPLCGA